MLIDEYQRIPAVLQAIKARLNKSTEAGMFVLAGSASYDSLPTGTQALTGRIQRLPVLPLTQTEIDGTMNRFVEQAFEGNIPHTADAATARRMDYVDRITRAACPSRLPSPIPSPGADGSPGMCVNPSSATRASSGNWGGQPRYRNYSPGPPDRPEDC